MPSRSTAFIAICVFLVGSCAKLPTNSNYPSTNITVGYGPEDMVLDTLTANALPRMLVSCSARRPHEKPHGEIWAIDLQNDKTSILPRKNEPAGMGFNPHGIDIVKRTDGKTYLYVVNHQDSIEKQSILTYVVTKDALLYENSYENPLLSSPNDVCFAPSGGFYWSNDLSSRKASLFEPLFRIKGGYIGHSDQKDIWKKSKNKFAYTNGLAVINNDLYISTVIQSKIFRFPNQDLTQKPETIGKVPGGDNITLLPDGNFLVTAHLRQIKFLKHRKDSQQKSPSVVYRVNPSNKEIRVVYADDGHKISAASTAIWYNGHLYICQVFDNFILKTEIKNL